MDYNSFAGKLKKTNCTVTKIELSYNQGDHRCWSSLINKDTDNIIVTHSINRYDFGTECFDVQSSSKFLMDVETDDIYDTIDLLLSKSFISSETENITETIE